MASRLEVDQVKHSGGVAFTLPTADGSAGQKLKTDGSGVLSFVSDTTSLSEDSSPQLGGDLDLNSNNITGTGNIPAANLTGSLPAISGASLTNLPGGGKVLQVIGTTGSSSTASTSNTAWVNYDTLGSITPASTSNKILVSLSYTMYAHTGGADIGGGAKIVRGSTDIGTVQTLYVATGGTPALQLNLYNRILDAPSSTSELTYYLFMRAQYGATIQTSYAWECVFMEVEG